MSNIIKKEEFLARKAAAIEANKAAHKANSSALFTAEVDESWERGINREFSETPDRRENQRAWRLWKRSTRR